VRAFYAVSLLGARMEYLYLALALIVWCLIVPFLVYFGATALGNAVRAIEKFFGGDL
jgi:hypothetical protein